MIGVQQLAMTATMARFLRGSAVELAWPDGRVAVAGCHPSCDVGLGAWRLALGASIAAATTLPHALLTGVDLLPRATLVPGPDHADLGAGIYRSGRVEVFATPLVPAAVCATLEHRGGDLSFRRDELTRTTLVCARPGCDALDLVTACAVAEVSLVLG
jgi:hypothetical protein